MDEKAKRVCLLTGAGGELGSTFCRLYRDRYEIVAVCRERRPDAPSQYQSFVDPVDPGAKLPENEHTVFILHSNLQNRAELARVVELALARHGRIDLLVNAAVHSVWAPIVNSNRLLDSMSHQFYINSIVPLHLAAEVARQFWRDRDIENTTNNRNVVNVSSIAGVYVFPHQGQSVYSASKAALNNLTCHMAEEFKLFGVRVNATAPDTFGSLVPTERAAESIVHLDVERVNGAILVVDAAGEHFV